MQRKYGIRQRSLRQALVVKVDRGLIGPVHLDMKGLEPRDLSLDSLIAQSLLQLL